MRALLGLSSCVALVAALTASVSALQSGQPAPDFTLPYSSGGGSVTLSKLRGHPVYLNFFATWCPPCNAEAPTVNEMQIKYRKQGLIVLGVDELENDAKANQYLQEHHLVFRAVVDDGSIHNSYAGFGLPVHVFIDRKGIVRLYRAGEMSNAEIEAAVKSIL